MIEYAINLSDEEIRLHEHLHSRLREALLRLFWTRITPIFPDNFLKGRFAPLFEEFYGRSDVLERIEP